MLLEITYGFKYRNLRRVKYNADNRHYRNLTPSTLFLKETNKRSVGRHGHTKVLSDLDEKMHGLEEHLLERPELARVINNVQTLSSQGVYAFDVLNVFSHAHDMRERKVLNGNE